MRERGRLSAQTAERPSVYTLTDSQLADEYYKLTGRSVQVPSRQSPSFWWAWRCDLQAKVMKERLQPRTFQSGA